MWRKLAEMTSPSSTTRPLTQVFPHSSSDSSTIPHSLTLAWTLTVRDTNTPLFTLKDRVSQNLLVTQTVLDNIHWTWNANLRLEMRVVHSFWDNKWLWLPLLLFFYLSVPTQTDAERCSRFSGTRRPLCVPAQRQSFHETREWMNTFSLPQPTPVFSPLPERSLRLPNSLAATVIGT